MKSAGKQERLFWNIRTILEDLPQERQQEAKRLLAQILLAVTQAWTQTRSRERESRDEQDHQ